MVRSPGAGSIAESANGSIVAAQRMDALTGVRALAALWVMGYHFASIPFAALHLGQALPLLKFGYLGVDLFFLLSGFIIAHVHRRDAGSLAPRAVLRFYGRRLARLYPVHLFTLLALLAILFAGSLLGIGAHRPETFRGADFFFNLILVQAWGVSTHLSWNFPAWSISCEWFAYLVFPLLALGLNRIVSPRQAIRWLAVTLAGFALAHRLLFNFDLDQPLNGLALTRIGFEFTAGALCCRLTEVVDLRALPWTILVLAGVVVAAALADTPVRDLVIVCVFGVVVAAGRYADNLVARLLSLPVLVYLGEISYSLYMVHVPVRMTLGKAAEHYIDLWGPSFWGFVVGAAFCLSTVLAAVAVYHLVEVPARGWLQRRFAAAEPSWPAHERAALPRNTDVFGPAFRVKEE